MKISVRLLATAAALCAPSMAFASPQDANPDRAAELLCSLGGLCEVADAEANREVGEDEDFEGRGIIGSREVRNAGSRRATPTPRPTVSQPRRNTTASRPAVVRTPTVRRPANVSATNLVAPEISLEVREKISAPLVVTFARNSAVLSKDAKSEIASLAMAMKQAQELGKPMKLEIEGHASRGRDSVEPWNMTLSERRAEAVREALLKELASDDFDPAQVTSKGYGSSKPLDVEGVDPGDKINQRVVAVPVD